MEDRASRTIELFSNGKSLDEIVKSNIGINSITTLTRVLKSVLGKVEYKRLLKLNSKNTRKVKNKDGQISSYYRRRAELIFEKSGIIIIDLPDYKVKSLTRKQFMKLLKESRSGR